MNTNNNYFFFFIFLIIYVYIFIVCRESKVPCVTNCTNAMQIVEDGDIVTVDGDVGRVMIVERNNNHLNGTVVASKL
jgi:phosphoenolpyruvate-protein kinase (PTS system EI component)